jgi:glycosyltransferase involved in cell wall biosynthesis
LSATLDLSLVIPIFNEAEHIARNVRTVTDYLDSLGLSYEVLLVDDGSVDGTKEILRSVRDEGRRRIRLLENPVNRGKGSVLNLGLTNARGEIVGFLDADLEIDVRYVGELLAALDDDASVAVGSRALEGGDAQRSPLRHLAHFGYNLLVRILLGSRVRDNSSGIKLMRKQVRDRVVPFIREEGWGWDVEFLVRAQMNGFAIREVPIRTVEQRISKVHVFRTMLQTTLMMLRLRAQGVRVRRTSAPRPRTPVSS